MCIIRAGWTSVVTPPNFLTRGRKFRSVTGVLWNYGTAAQSADLCCGSCCGLTSHHKGGCGGHHGCCGYHGFQNFQNFQMRKVWE